MGGKSRRHAFQTARQPDRRQQLVILLSDGGRDIGRSTDHVQEAAEKHGQHGVVSRPFEDVFGLRRLMGNLQVEPHPGQRIFGQQSAGVGDKRGLGQTFLAVRLIEIETSLECVFLVADEKSRSRYSSPKVLANADHLKVMIFPADEFLLRALADELLFDDVERDLEESLEELFVGSLNDR